MMQQVRAAVVLAGLSALTGCGEAKYDKPPVVVLKEHPDYAIGKKFEVEGTPQYLGSYSFDEHVGGGFAATYAKTHRHLYKVGDIAVISKERLPDSCSGVRGTWKKTPVIDKAREAIADTPEYALIVDTYRETVTSWRSK